MPTKKGVYRAEYKALEDADGKATGQVEALVSVFNNVDLQGDRILPGAFQKSIAEWKASGDPVPVVFSHDWGDVWSHIGVVDDMRESEDGLVVKYSLDIQDNPVAAQAYRLMKRRSLKEHSFAYDIVKERTAKDGANELQELKVIEVGPTLKGANPETELIGVKGALEALADAAEEKAIPITTTSTTTNAANVTVTGDGFLSPVEYKAGRAVSATNEKRIRDAITAVQDASKALEEILVSLEATSTVEDNKASTPTAKSEEPIVANDEEHAAEDADIALKTALTALEADFWKVNDSGND